MAVAFPVALLLGFAARAAGRRLGALDHPDSSLKPHARAVPYLGGLAVAGGVAAGVATRGWPLRWGVTVALFAPVFLGLADDARRVPEALRLGLQVAFGVALVLGGLNVDACCSPAGIVYGLAAVVFYAAVLNAVNMVDGMDGLAGSLAVVSGAGIVVIAVTVSASWGRPGIVAACAAAAAAGFVIHNLPPARLFLGDNGSYFVGAALAIAALQAGIGIPALAGASGCLGVFLLDLMLSVLRRLTGRVALHQGDRGHLYDQLLARGLSVWATLGVCLVVHTVLVGAAVVAAQLSKAGAVSLLGAVWAAAIGALFAMGFVRYRQPEPAR
ncbi:MAG TPA: MraY family glycosyltransferase [Actinomycetota bacterium]